MFTVTCICSLTGQVFGQPMVSTWPAASADDAAAVAAAPLAGRYAVGDAFEDSVEVRGIATDLRRTVTRAQIEALLPWMDLDGGPDGIGGLAMTDSGRLAFVLVHDDTTAGDGQPSDAILRFDVLQNQISVFRRLELFDNGSMFPHLAAAHFDGRLFVGTQYDGVRVYRALSSDLTGIQLSNTALPDGGAVHGLAIDRLSNVVYAASSGTIYRADLTTLPLSFQTVGSIADIQSIGYSDHFGGSGQSGLYVLTFDGASMSSVHHVPAAQALGIQAFAPTVYLTANERWHDLAGTADGRLLIGADEDARMIRDASDTRLGYDEWLADEFAQVVAFGKGLISPDGEPDGWVIDGDVVFGGSRFQPATPDGAAWVVFLLLLNDQINNDPEAQSLIRSILTRYADLAPDGIGPSRSPDGFFRHWINPQTGNTKPGWPTEFATYSTMKIVAAANRAAAYYPHDQEIQAAASAIVCPIQNWDGYIHPGNDGVYLISDPSGGPQCCALNVPFVEGILYVEQAAVYGGTASMQSFARWINRSLWPTATYVSGHPVSGSSAGQFHPAFVTLYSALVQQPFRADPAWRTQVENVRATAAAWTDDHGPRWMTIFSAGTTKPEWGGYHADNINDHPGDIATFTSLMALSAFGETAEAVGAYNAYRRGARQLFDSGATILYRRSSVDITYTPPDAGLPDTALGAIGLAELLSPGVLDAVLARPYLRTELCPCIDGLPGDCFEDGAVDLVDLNIVIGNFGTTGPSGDCNGDGAVDVGDLNLVLGNFGISCD